MKSKLTRDAAQSTYPMSLLKKADVSSKIIQEGNIAGCVLDNSFQSQGFYGFNKEGIRKEKRKKKIRKKRSRIPLFP